MEHLSRHSHISFFLGGWGMIWFESNFDWKIEQPKKLSSPVFSITVSSGVILQLAILLIKPPHFLGTSSGGVWSEARLCSHMSLPQTKTERTITCFVTYMEYMVLQAGLIHTCREEPSSVFLHRWNSWEVCEHFCFRSQLRCSSLC